MLIMKHVPYLSTEKQGKKTKICLNEYINCCGQNATMQMAQFRKRKWNPNTTLWQGSLA